MSIQPRTRSGVLATLLLTVVLPHGEARAEEPNPQVKVTTNMGEFVIEVRQDRSPLTAANVLCYVREGLYSATLIRHSVDKGAGAQEPAHVQQDVRRGERGVALT